MTGSTPDRGSGRREQTRRRTLRELHEAALAEVREHGAVELSLRRVARRMGMSPAGLYRYVDSREDLLTRLITAAYDDLADHLGAALGDELDDRLRAELRSTGMAAGQRSSLPPVVAGPDTDVTERLRAVAVAYRAWAVAHPNEFGLLFGDPIPGYAAPPGGPTVTAMSRMGAALGRPLVEAHAQQRLRLLAATPVPQALAERLAPLAEMEGQRVPPELALTLLAAWGRLHGPVTLEVFGHHAWLLPDGAEALFEPEVERIVDDLIAPPPAE